ncbi:hypothetical protein TspCOW1_21350 [Thiohalobacter sp. COW1]|uniref:NYN domain-containing protein n=1 Tax=Thiohalobacter sp. COW1 TaxID=2795687 RepID=UPI00191509E7|nr:NYN domain-containing protein [Thiohalobacter sp. COW1]BCO32032.1 hypothetical protein TspCOW1_21350 [Thiohalobacter sp. COW1]
MSLPTRYAVLLDGGFVLKKLQQYTNRFPTADDVEKACERLHSHESLKNCDLLRVYFYHAPPANEELVNPLDKSKVNLAETQIYHDHEKLLSVLEMRPNFALRLGETVTYQWKLGKRAMDSIMENTRAVEPRDLVPNVMQKGVDLRIGLDIARLSLQGTVQAIVVATGDSDLIPAFKFARREGVRVYLDHMGHGIRRDLKAHADIVIDTPLPKELRNK